MKRMWGVKKVFSFMFLALTVFALLTACGGGGGGGSDGGSNPPSSGSGNATITGTVSGTTVKAFDLSGNEVASNTATGNPKTFSLNVPAGGSYKFYLIENEGTSSERVYALYQGTTNVFNIASAVTIDLGVIFVNTSTGVAVPENNLLNATGVTSGGVNTTIPPGLIKQYTASGTYIYNNGALTLNTTSSDFVCEGPPVGASNFTVTSITATTMIWDGGTENEMTWIRPSGTAGDILGTWTMSGTDNSYTLTFNADGTFSLAGHILQCNDGGGGNSAQAYSQHWSTGYYSQFHVEDPTQQYTSVTVTGPYISGSLSLTYNQGGWERAVNDIFIGTTPPAAPLIYNFTLVSSTSTTYLTDNIEAFVGPFVTNLSPSGSGVSATPTFSWTGIGSGYTYFVELHNSNGNIIWFSGINLTTTFVAYTGPALTSGATYYYNVMARDSYQNWSAVRESFVVQ